MDDFYKIIIVDDEFFIRDGLMSYQWEELGFKAIGAASDGQEALILMNKSPADVIIADIKMPIMDGLKLSEVVQKKYPNCKVVLLTGHKSFDYAKKAITTDVFDYVLKPVKQDYLRKIFIKLKNIIDKENEDKEKEDALLLKLKQKTSSPPIIKTIDYVKKHYQEKISLKKISEIVYLNSSYLSTLFKEETGENFVTFLTEYRLYKSKQLLQKVDLKIYQIAHMVGFSNPKYFSDVFKRETGLTPCEYRQKQVK